MRVNDDKKLFLSFNFKLLLCRRLPWNPCLPLSPGPLPLHWLGLTSLPLIHLLSTSLRNFCVFWWSVWYPLLRRGVRFLRRSKRGVQLIAWPGTQYSFHISGNRGYDSNHVRYLSIFHSYLRRRRLCGNKYNHAMLWRGMTQHQDSGGSKTQGSQKNTPSTG